MPFLRLISASAFALLIFDCTATAATIVARSGSTGSVVISVSGELVRGDEDRFVQVAGSLARAVVAFESPGGHLSAGISIGKIIRFKNFDTLVPNGSVCASACALAWLGGASRLMGATSRIGFHAPSTRRSGIVTASPEGNALVREYLDELGLSAAAIVYIVETPPEKMNWLHLNDARNVGIEVLRAGRPL